MPLDSHTCIFLVYPLYYDKSQIILNFNNEKNPDGSYRYMSIKDINDQYVNGFKFTEFKVYDTDTQIYYSDKTYSGIKYVCKLSRKEMWEYYLFALVIPSILFNILSYCGFWIDKNGVPGRVYLGSLAILMNINAYVLPRVSETTWLSNFLLGSMAFGCFTMIEY